MVFFSLFLPVIWNVKNIIADVFFAVVDYYCLILNATAQVFHSSTTQWENGSPILEAATETKNTKSVVSLTQIQAEFTQHATEAESRDAAKNS